MAYIHESQLQKAIKRLYMLGGPDRKPGSGTGGEDGPLADAMSVGIGRIPKKKSMSWEDKLVRGGTTPAPLPQSMQHSDEEIAQHFANLKAAENAQKLGEMAGQIPQGGVWTKEGFDNHVAETQDKQADMNLSNTLMAHGVELNTRGGMGRSQHGISPLSRGQ